MWFLVYPTGASEIETLKEISYKENSNDEIKTSRCLFHRGPPTQSASAFQAKQKACAPGSLVHTSALSSDNTIISDVHIVLRRWNVNSFQNDGCIACDKINSYVRESYEGRARIYADK